MTNHILRSEGFVYVHLNGTEIEITHKDYDETFAFQYESEQIALEKFQLIYDQINTQKFTSF